MAVVIDTSREPDNSPPKQGENRKAATRGVCRGTPSTRAGPQHGTAPGQGFGNASSRLSLTVLLRVNGVRLIGSA